MEAQGALVALGVLIALKAFGALKTHLLLGALRSLAASKPQELSGSPGSIRSLRSPRSSSFRALRSWKKLQEP